MRIGMTLAAVVLVAACSTAEEGTTVERVECPRPGVVLREAHTTGCLTESGEIVVTGAHVCSDGRLLFAEFGMYGFVGEPVEVGDAADPGFAAAYEECLGG